MVVVDLYGKKAHFILTYTTCSAMGAAKPVITPLVRAVHSGTTGMCQLHLVFNMVKLILTPKDPIPGQCPSPLPPPVVVNNNKEYEVEEILDSHLFQRQLQYKVKWKGYGIDDISWEPQENIHAPRLVKEFHWRHADTSCTIQGIYPILPVD
ncbi:Chromobox like protein [Termitomyces sp. J132]|nr:Chromobox like protein [Termitomyces sp. J132]